ncbi:hypothetical protein KR054_012556 [Drosophila jambulina]|nr:hypothetical protein KR054_012556 [Drosophila jambulina]
MRHHTRLWLFAAMQISVMLSMIDIVIKIELPVDRISPRLRANLKCKLSELAYSPLLSGSAMSTMFYGYGLVYVQADGCLDSFLSRIREASLSVWDWCGPVMFLPWLIRVGQGLFRFPFFQVEDANGIGGSNTTLLTILAVYFWSCVLFLALGSLFMAIKVNRQLIRFRRVRFMEPEIVDYARRINELTGYEIIQLDT